MSPSHTCITKFNKINSSFQLAIPFFSFKIFGCYKFSALQSETERCFTKSNVFWRSSGEEVKHGSPRELPAGMLSWGRPIGTGLLQGIASRGSFVILIALKWKRWNAHIKVWAICPLKTECPPKQGNETWCSCIIIETKHSWVKKNTYITSDKSKTHSAIQSNRWNTFPVYMI